MAAAAPWTPPASRAGLKAHADDPSDIDRPAVRPWKAGGQAMKGMHGMSGDEIEPVRLVEDETTGDRFLVYGTDKGLRLDIRYEGESPT